MGILFEAFVKALVSNKSLPSVFLMRIFALTDFSHSESLFKNALLDCLSPISSNNFGSATCSDLRRGISIPV